MDDTQNTQSPGSEAAQQATDGAGTTTLDLTNTAVGSSNEASPNGSEPTPTLGEALNASVGRAAAVELTDAEKGAEIVASEQERAAAVAAATPISPIKAAGAHGIISKLESEFEEAFAKGQSAFRTWWASGIAELKEHLKV